MREEDVTSHQRPIAAIVAARENVSHSGYVSGNRDRDPAEIKIRFGSTHHEAPAPRFQLVMRIQ